MNILIDGQTLETPEVNRGIGIYFKNVLNNMMKNSYGHNWYITLTNKSSLEVLDRWVVERLIPIENKIFTPSTDYDKTDRFTFEMESIVKAKKIDLFWCPNPLMINVLCVNKTLKCRMYFMLHDIIPFIKPVKEWSNSVKTEYSNRLKFLKSTDINILCNSHATKSDFKDLICDREGLHVTELAADHKKFYRKKWAEGIDSSEPYIMFTGGFDYRKNMDGAVKALAKANELYPNDEIISKLKIVIVCSTDAESERRFYSSLDNIGLKDKVKLTGFISDQELSNLYANCDLFFLPSQYEGFGLPIVEAMLGGAYVLSADNSSLPEVCGGHAMLCDANDIDDMGKKIKLAIYQSKNETVQEKNARQDYALTFSWEKTAEKTLKLFENNKMPSEIKKLKLAIVTPWPQQKSGVAYCQYKLIPYLSEYFNIDIFVDNTAVNQFVFLPNDYGNIYMIDKLDKYHNDYDEIIYQMGNSADHHTGIYNAMLKYKGIVEIHDYILHPFFYHSYFLKKNYNIYEQALKNGYGEEGLEHYRTVRENSGFPDNEKYAMSQSVINISKASIFHNHWSKNQVNNDNIFVIPLGAYDKEGIAAEACDSLLSQLKKSINYREEFVVGCFGFVNSNKRGLKVLEAVERLVKSGFKIKLVFFGECHYNELETYIQNNELDNFVTITGYLSEQEYDIAMRFIDLCVNLRFPSMGETSATLHEAFNYSKPVIVSDLNQYKEYPDDVCWKVPIDRFEVETLSALIKYLIDHEDVRAALGQNAKRYADTVLSPKRIASMYYTAINKIFNRGD